MGRRSCGGEEKEENCRGEEKEEIAAIQCGTWIRLRPNNVVLVKSEGTDGNIRPPPEKTLFEVARIKT